ncbi:E3 ubiquitin-protein ligase RING1-like [Solanum dulcamara]|uniref:E3 ubiquitin-protein ligase RING1-like n=1 Tax=Solanum dulcamara TaxID=45834 RepID=UPI00248670A0|nr:E3 ubiquitin-protein ligase RING1-like [Solanum dulcamara]
MSTEATLSTASSRRSYRCYNCNDAFHITNSAGVSSSFRCPRCFHRHLLPNYTIASLTPLFQPFTANFTLSTINSVTFDYSDSETDSDESDSDDFSFELFNSTQFRSPTLKSFLDSLPIVKIDESSKNCPICMEEFGIDTEASQLPCKHYFHYDCIVPWLNRSNTCPLCRHKLPRQAEDEIEKDLQVILDGENGDREFQDNSVVLVSTASSLGLSEVGEDDDDLRERDLDEMRDEDGDIMMVDA